MTLLATATGLAIGPHAGEAVSAWDFSIPVEHIALPQSAERSKMYDSYGSLMVTLADSEEREWISIDRIPETVINGVLVVEDANFWTHKGVDYRATLRAAIANLTAGGITGGGSTITQQVIKLSTLEAEQSISRKLKEAQRAMQLEKDYTKEEILEFYLNQIYFGNSAYGIEAAAEIYFGKRAFELDYGDVALLAGLIRSPGRYTWNDPDSPPKIQFASDRRARSVERLLSGGYIDDLEAIEINSRPVPTFNRSPRQQDETFGRFAEEVKRELLEMPELGDTRQARAQKIFRGGLRIYSTYDPRLERLAEDAIDEIFPNGLNQFAVALASVEPSTGAIKVMASSVPFEDDQFNLATQGLRQPGSSFKTYVLTTLVEQGFNPNGTEVSGISPCAFDQGANLPPYIVGNFSRNTGTVKSVRGQTLSSSNCAFVRLGLFVGLNNVVDMATKMIGLEEGRLQPFASISLGAQELTPLEQAIGYSVLSNGGVRMEPYIIERITDRDGNIVFEHVPTGRQVIAESTARMVTSVLESNVQGGTGTRARLGDGRPAAGKTGTTDDYEDAWFVGFTDELSTAVWMGNPEEKEPMRGVFGRSTVTGGSFPAQVWNAFMSSALEDLPIYPFDSALGGGKSEFIFLPDEECEVVINPAEGSEITTTSVYEISCAFVDIDDGGYDFDDEAICDVLLPDADGVLQPQKVRCKDWKESLSTTSTTEEETTTSEGGDTTTTGSTTTTAGPTTTTSATTTTTIATTTTAATTTTTSTPPGTSSSSTSTTSGG